MYIKKHQKVCKILKLDTWKLPSLAHFPMISVLYWKTYDSLQNLLNVTLEWFISFLTKQRKNLVQNSQMWGNGISEKGGERSDYLVCFPYYPPYTFVSPTTPPTRLLPLLPTH